MKKFLVCLIVTLVIGSTTVESGQISALVTRGVSYPITKSIRDLQPRLSWKQANEHATIILAEAERSGIDWKLILAIAHLESSLTKFKGDWTCGFTKALPNKYQCIYRSFGPMHVVYMFWWRTLQLDHKKLKYDLAYGYYMGVRILEIKREQYDDPDWFTQYNAKSAEFQELYARLVNKRIIRINNFLARQ